VIQTHNNYYLSVFNGDTGTVVAIDDTPSLTVDFGDGRLVEYGAADVLDLDHAYGLTVHRSQGSEWPGVVVLASSSFGQILSRNLLYTALTRARRAVVVVGDEAAIGQAVARMRDQERVTGLPVLLKETGVRSQETGEMAPAPQPPSRPSSLGPFSRSASPLPPTPFRPTMGPLDPHGPASRERGSPVEAVPPVPESDDADVPDNLAEASSAPWSEEPYEPMPDDWPDDDAW
jgi:hypothetical protein